MEVLNAHCAQQVFHPILVETVGAALAEGIAGVVGLRGMQRILEIHIQNHPVFRGTQPAARVAQLGPPNETVPHIFHPLEPGQVGHFTETVLAVIKANPGVTQGPVVWKDVEIGFVGQTVEHECIVAVAGEQPQLPIVPLGQAPASIDTEELLAAPIIGNSLRADIAGFFPYVIDAAQPKTPVGGLAEERPLKVGASAPAVASLVEREPRLPMRTQYVRVIKIQTGFGAVRVLRIANAEALA